MLKMVGVAKNLLYNLRELKLKGVDIIN